MYWVLASKWCASVSDNGERAYIKISNCMHASLVKKMWSSWLNKFSCNTNKWQLVL